MITLRQGKAKTILENSINSALAAVENYNRPNAKFRIENYIVLMIIAWTKLFHAYFQTTIGEKYFYKNKKGKYIKIDEEKKAWDLAECVKYFQKLSDDYKLSTAVIDNLNFFLGIRNKIEHRYWNSSSLDILLFGECQALLYNYENKVIAIFGEEYALNTSLAYALQFSQLRLEKQLTSQRQLLSKDMQDIKKYIDKYRTDLAQEIYDSQEFSVKLLQIPKVSNTNRSDLAIEFVNWNSISEEDKENFRKITAIIKDKIVKQNVYNAKLLKPSGVVKAVKEATSLEFKTSDNTALWKAFGVRPDPKATTKFETNDKYCIYDEVHNDYLYTNEWVSFICNLMLNHGFTRDNIQSRCKEKLKIEDYIQR